MRFAASLLLVFFLVLVLAAASGETARAQSTRPSLDALLARARSASGAPYRYHVVSRSRESDGARLFDVTTETEGLNYRAKRCSGDVCTGFYFDGERSYDSNFNDTALPLSSRVDGLQATLRAIASYEFTAPEFRRSGGTLTERDPVASGSKKFRRISVSAPLGAVLDAVIDPDTNLVVGVISDERKIAFEFRDQRAIDGKITLPFAVFLNGVQLERFDARVISSVPLGAPGGIVPQISGATDIPFQRDGDRPIVACDIGGQRVTCLLDTSSSGLSMSVELAARLGLSPQTIAAGTSQQVAGIVKAPALSIGGARYGTAFYVVAHGLHENGYDIVLGADAFAHARIAIDFGRRTVTFGTAGLPLPGAVGIGFDNFVPIVPVRISDGVVLPLAVDTGDDASVEVVADDYLAHRALFALADATDGGGRIPLVRLGAYGVSLVRLDATRRLPPAGEGRIGDTLLQHFKLTFDYSRSEVALTPREGDTAVRAAP
jgi:hypothetical protein